MKDIKGLEYLKVKKMKVKVKKLRKDAVLPSKAHPTDAGFDLTAVSRVFDAEGNVTYGFGLAFEIPEGYVGLIFPRSSICRKDLALSNAVAVIDAHYRGEVTAKFKPTLSVATDKRIGKDEFDWYGTDDIDFGDSFVSFNGRKKCYPDVTQDCAPFPPRFYAVGERIAQMIIMPIPQIEFEEADELSSTDRGANGYGSTGR